jgi:molybdate/tungstate transport system substrate-binding protein
VSRSPEAAEGEESRATEARPSICSEDTALGMRFIPVLVLLVSLAMLATPAQAADRAITIFYADSLTGYVDSLSRQFQASHRGVEIHGEALGSLDAIRRVTDLHQMCDIVISADWRLLAKLRHGIEPWVMIFAGNSIGILYGDGSRDANEITPHNWYEILTRPGVRVGHSNPERDPAGYWTLVMWQLAERYYRKPGLAARLDAACPRANIRPKAIDFTALVESGDIDYFFGYASDARRAGLKFLQLPLEINLGDIARASDYASAHVRIGTGANAREIVGAPIAYGATLASDAPGRTLAIEFLKAMADEPGERAAKLSGLIPYSPARSFDFGNKMPAELRALCEPLNPR